MEPTTVLPAIALLSLVTVESGGWALLGFITKRRGTLGPFREQQERTQGREGYQDGGDRQVGAPQACPPVSKA